MNFPERKLVEIKAEYAQSILDAATKLHRDLLAMGFKISRLEPNIITEGMYLGRTIVVNAITSVTVSLTVVPVGSDGSVSVVV